MHKRNFTIFILVLAIIAFAGGINLARAETAADALSGRMESVKKRQKNRVAQEQREAAAEARKNMKGKKAAGIDASGAPLAALAVPAPGPGGTPDYVGSPNWAYSPPLRKFVDGLPGLGAGNANNLGQYIPVAVPDTVTYPGSDYYEIELRQYTEKMHSDLPPTTLRGYAQVRNGADVSPVRYLGPAIVARKDRPVRIKFTNKLPVGAGGDLFIPVDTTVMGAGMGPLGMDAMPMNYTQNRGTLHLHGGRSPWISDGTPHQWVTPADEITPYPAGVSVQNVPDMPDPGDGSMTFYYTNQQSARLMFYHDHSYGITRLNVYAGEAAGYIIEDDEEQQLIASGVIPADQIPLIIQDKSFVDAATVRTTDPTWNWGTGAPDPNGVRPPVTGDLWYPHVYVPAQNPYDISGVNPYGRWHYGPWFWPPTSGITYPPVPNPYYDPVGAPWQPPEMPGVPHPSMPGESFFDTAIVNGTAFPTLTVQPKSYRLRILNAANDRFWNLQLYVADPAVTTADGRTNTEVKMVPAADTPNFPPTWPMDGRTGGVPDPATAGPPFIQIGTEGGFLPAPVVVLNQPIAWNRDPTTFNFGNVTDHALLLGPAERADAIVDFSAYAGKTLILYNDAPAAFPALDQRYDYYTGAPDLTDTGGHPGPQAGFGPNTRTIMQISVAAATPAPAFDLARLEAEFTSTATSQGVFARAQDPIIVGQTAYNTAYNTTFPTTWPNWGISRIQDNSLSFRTVSGGLLTLPMEPKAIQDEMGEAFDLEYGRMSGKLGLELPSTRAGRMNFVLQNYVDPPTEIITASPAVGPPVAGDGTQIWKITHNGVDTHPIHFHLFDVQLLNRVGWDGAIRLPDENELGWKDTVRISPLEDTIVALRPVTPRVPFSLPDSVRPLDPAMPLGNMMGFTNIDPHTGEPLATPTMNDMFNFGWEFVWHCHILSHEEMDMMRPIKFLTGSVSVLPAAPSGLAAAATGPQTARLTWTDNSNNETAFRIERAVGAGAFSMLAIVTSNRTWYNDVIAMSGMMYNYRVIAFNGAGDSAASNTAQVTMPLTTPQAPSGLTATAASSTRINLAWTDNSAAEQGFTIERATDAAFTAGLTAFTAPANATTYADTTGIPSTTYYYRVQAYNGFGPSAWTNTASASTFASLPLAPSNLAANVNQNPLSVALTWTDNSAFETGTTIQRATNSAFSAGLTTFTAGANATAYNDTTVAANTIYYYRVRAFNNSGDSAWSNTVSANTVAVVPVPAAPSGLTVTMFGRSSVSLAWTDNATNETGFTVQRATNATFTSGLASFPAGANAAAFNNTGLTSNVTYYYRVRANNAAGSSAWSNVVSARTTTLVPNIPTGVTVTDVTANSISIGWTDNSAVESGYYVEMRIGTGAWTRIATLAPNTTSYTSTGLTAGVNYCYRAQAFNGNGTQGYSAIVCATTTGAGGQVPAAPSGLTAAAASTTSINLAWTDASADESGFTIQRATDSAFTAGLTTFTAGVNATTYNDTTAAANTTYYYRVRSYNNSGTSAWSNTASASTGAVSQIQVPGNFAFVTTATGTTATITLTWTWTGTNPASFHIQRSSISSAFPTPANYIRSGSSRSYTQTGLTRGKTYYFRIQANTAAGASEWAPTLAITTP